MFNKDFYPTPEHLISKMFSKVNKKSIKNILEPSAGKGNIVDYLKNLDPHNRYRNFETDCIEQDKELQSFLKGKGYRLIFDDFLNFNTMKKYDLIIMNPPFSGGDKHLLKAISLMKEYGGQIVCILNAETLKNPYTVYRQDLKFQLEDYKAEIEFIEKAFSDAERKTSVDIAMVYINIPSKVKESNILKNLQKAKEHKTKENQYTQVVRNDFIEQIIERYNFEINAGIKLIEEYNLISPLLKNSFEAGASNILQLQLNKDRKYNLINDFIESIREKYWKALFNNPNFSKAFTSNLLIEFHSKLSELAEYDFNHFNINEIQKELSAKMIISIETAILELFDELSYKNSYNPEFQNNIHYYNGWKTNKAHKINKKIIIPLKATNWYSGELEYSWKIFNKLSDIEKVLNYLNNKDVESIDLEKTLELKLSLGFTRNIDCKYFTVTFYKKGTCHITFKDDDLLLKFNILGSQKKGWLPPRYGKKAYEEMEQEEQDVINEFQGEKEYNKVYKNPNLYLNLINNILMIEEQ